MTCQKKLKDYNLTTENEKERDKIHQIIKDTFIIANEKLLNNEEINSLLSGSTFVSVIYTPEKLIVSNIGDSRAVHGHLVNKEKKKTTRLIYLMSINRLKKTKQKK